MQYPPLAERLPDFPWDLLAPYASAAAEHPGGVIDLSVGTPVDPVPDIIQRALVDAANSPGYPTVAGTAALRQVLVTWAARTLGATVETVLPTVGSKELVASLAVQLGCGPGDTVVIPSLAYPTYEVGARLAGARVVRADTIAELDSIPGRVSLIWLNSPANPTGRVLGRDELAALVTWARERAAVVVNDECYLELGGTAGVTSILDRAVSGPSHENVLALHSLSKRSNCAGYRCGVVLGDAGLVAGLLETRRHLGLIVAAPTQAAAAVAFADDAHVAAQREVYSRRRALLAAAFTSAGVHLEHGTAGLYLWGTRGEPCWDTLAWCAERGILATPGDFYGPAGAAHIRITLTATDAAVAEAVVRLAG